MRSGTQTVLSYLVGEGSEEADQDTSEVLLLCGPGITLGTKMSVCLLKCPVTPETALLCSPDAHIRRPWLGLEVYATQLIRP